MPSLRIGVLGGIGPQSTGEFYLSLIHKLQKSGTIKSNRDFPQIVINSVPAPELMNKEITEDQLIPYKEGVLELDSFGVDFIVMVCNTIHLKIDELQQECSTPIINLRNEMQQELERQNVTRLSVLGTPSTVSSGLYHFPELTYVDPGFNELQTLASCIVEFNAGRNKEEQIRKTKSIISRLLVDGSQCIVLGCTEFAVMCKDIDVRKISSIDLLSDIVVRKCTGTKVNTV